VVAVGIRYAAAAAAAACMFHIQLSNDLHHGLVGWVVHTMCGTVGELLPEICKCWLM
jgi:hypothetical protein